MSNDDWTRVEDGEYNEQHIRAFGHSIMIFSNYDEDQWECIINGTDCFTLDATEMHAARFEAIKEARKWNA